MKGSIQQEAMISLMRASSRIRRQFGEVCGDHAIGGAQYNILRILEGAGGSLPIMTIRARMIDPEPSITRLVDRLEERGRVERVRSKTDRRSVECRLTDAGRKLLHEVSEPIDRRDRELMSRLSGKELRTLTKLLDKVGLPE